MKLLRSIALVCFLAGPLPALACSPRHIDTAQQLAQRADGIYRVRAVAYLPGDKANESITPWPSAQVRFEILAVLKGPELEAVQFPGELTQRNDPNDHPVPYNFVRPDGRHGNCYAVTYKKGQEYLLFLKDGTPYWSPLAPTNEQVVGPQDPWVLWTQKQLGA